MKLLHRDRQSLAALDTFLDNMRLDAAAMRAPAPSPRLAATLDGRRPLRAATAPFLVPSPAPRRWRDLRPASRPIAAAVLSSAVLFGGLTSAGALPKPVQHAGAELGSRLGIHLPGFTAPNPAPTAPASVESGASGTPNPSSPARPPAPPAAPGPTTTTTPPAGAAAPPTPPVAGAPELPVVPLLPTLPTTPALPIPDPGTLIPLTPPPIGLPLPTLPAIVIPLPTEASPH